MSSSTATSVRRIERDELFVAYQPIVDLTTGRIVGVEALARWTHPTRGPIPPVEFIPVAEANGLIITIGEFVLREACQERSDLAGDPARTSR